MDSSSSGTSRKSLTTGSKDADYLSLRQLGKESKVQISQDNLEIQEWPSRLCLFAVCNRRGCFIAATNSGFVIGLLSALREALPSSSPLNPQYVIDLPSPMAFVKFVCDGDRFVVATRQGHLRVYDTPSDLKDRDSPTAQGGSAQLSPKHEFTQSQDTILDIQTNPSDRPEIIATLRRLSSGESRVDLLDIQKCEFIGSINGGSGPASQTAIAWSPKGKQLVIGNRGGRLIQYTPDGTQKSVLAQPTTLESQQEVASVLWLENTVFFVVYSDPAGQGHDYAPFIIVHDSKAGSTTDIAIEDPCPAWGRQDRLSARFYAHLKSWEPTKHLLFVGDAPADEVGTVACLNDTSLESPWTKLDLDDTARATLPLLPDGSPSCILGLEVDLTSETPISTSTQFGDDAPTLPPAPILLAYTNEGYVLGYRIMNSKEPSYPGMTPLSTTTPQSPTMSAVMTPKTPPRAPAPALGFASTTPSQTPFGVTTTPKFGQTGFGVTSPVATFGQSGFGSTTPLSTPVTQPAASAFGQTGFAGFATPNAAPAFGQSAFGSASSSTTSAFGQTGFGTSTTPTSAPAFGGFGQTGFASTPSSAPAFGQASFGAKQATSAFGQPSFGQTPAAPGFGQTSFGAKPAVSAFGQSGFGFGGAGGSGFGQSGFGSTAPKPASFGGSAVSAGKGFGGFSSGGSTGFASLANTSATNVFGGPAPINPALAKVSEEKDDDSMHAQPQTPPVTSSFSTTPAPPRSSGLAPPVGFGKFAAPGASTFSQPAPSTTTADASLLHADTKPPAPIFGSPGFSSFATTAKPTFGSATSLTGVAPKQPAFGASGFGASAGSGFGAAVKPIENVSSGGGFGAFAAKAETPSGFTGFGAAASKSGSFGDMLKAGGEAAISEVPEVFGQTSGFKPAPKSSSAFSFGSRMDAGKSRGDDDDDDAEGARSSSAKDRFPEAEMEAQEPTQIADPNDPGLFGGKYIPAKSTSQSPTSTPPSRVSSNLPTATIGAGLGGLSFGGETKAPSTSASSAVFGGFGPPKPSPKTPTTPLLPRVPSPQSTTPGPPSSTKSPQPVENEEEEDVGQGEDGENGEESDDSREDDEDFVISATDEEDGGDSDEADGAALNESYVLAEGPSSSPEGTPVASKGPASRIPKPIRKPNEKPAPATPSGYESEDEESAEPSQSTTPKGPPIESAPQGQPIPSLLSAPIVRSRSLSPPGPPTQKSGPTATPTAAAGPSNTVGLGRPTAFPGRGSAFSSIPVKSSPLATPPISGSVDSSPEKPLPAPRFLESTTPSKDSEHSEQEDDPASPTKAWRTAHGGISVPLPDEDKETTTKRPKTPPLSAFGLGFGAGSKSKPPASATASVFDASPSPFTAGPPQAAGGFFNFGRPASTPPSTEKPSAPNAPPAKQTSGPSFSFGRSSSPTKPVSSEPALAPARTPTPLSALAPVFKPPAPPSAPPVTGMEAEFLRVISLTESGLGQIKNSVSNFAKEQEGITRSASLKTVKPGREDIGDASKWQLGDVKSLKKLLLSLEDDVMKIKDTDMAIKTQLANLESSNLKAETCKEEIGRYIRARSDPEFAKLVKVRHLGPEHAENQQRLRKVLQLVSERLQQLEDIVAESKRKIDQSKTGKRPMQTPTLDMINRSLTRIQRGAQGRVEELDRLTERLANLEVSTESPASPHFDIASADAAVRRAGPLSSKPSLPSVAVRQDAAAALNAERAGARLKEALLLVRSAPLLNRPLAEGNPAGRPTVVKPVVSAAPRAVKAPQARPVPNLNQKHLTAKNGSFTSTTTEPLSRESSSGFGNWSTDTFGQSVQNTNQLGSRRSIFDMPSNLPNATNRGMSQPPRSPKKTPTGQSFNRASPPPRRGYGLSGFDLTTEDDSDWVDARGE